MPILFSPFPFLAKIPDWRHSKNRQYSWETLWTVILVGLLTGPENILALSQWMNHNGEALKQHLNLTQIPQQATIYRFFKRLEQHLPKLQAALLAWVKDHPDLTDMGLAILAGDGKVMKGTARQGERALSFVSVFFHELALTIGQQDQAGRHEARAMEDLIPTIVAVFGRDWLLTLDAAYTEKTLTSKIIEAGGAYLVPLKNNAKAMKEWAKIAFDFAPNLTATDTEFRSGETWERTTSIQTAVPEFITQALPNAKTLIRRTHRITHRDGRVTTEVRYAVCSLLLNAEQAEDIWRGHWGIENRSHHRRDTVFNEDRCRLRCGAQGRAMLHGMLLPLLYAKTKHLTAMVRQLRSDPLLALKFIRPDLYT